MDIDKVEFRVVMYTQNIEGDYSLTTIAQAEGNMERVKHAYESSKAFEKRQIVRLKNGFFYHTGDDDNYSTSADYKEEIEYKLINKLKLGEKPQTLPKEDCLIALAYAAEHNDVEEVVELVEDAGPEILSTPMPFALLGTILHVCTEWSSLQTLEKVVTDYPHSLDVLIRDKCGDTALHNIPYTTVKAEKSYDYCKCAARCLLDLADKAGVHAHKLLAVQNDYGQMTALCRALTSTSLHASRALLDAAKENFDSIRAPQRSDAAIKELEETSATNKAEHWLASTANGWSIDDVYRSKALQYADVPTFCTALHLAVLGGYKDIVTQILAYPGVNELHLTSFKDHRGNTPLHVAAMLGNQEICSMLLKYGVAINKDGSGGVKSQNNDGETPLHIAATYGSAEVCEKLLQYGASLSSKDNRGRYALTNASVRSHTEVVEKLLDACLSANKAKHSSTTSVETEPSALINAKSTGGSLYINEHFALGLTPLHVAVAISSKSYINNLIEAGALVDSRSDDGRTSLHVAAQHHNVDTLECLLNASTSKSMVRGKGSWINMRDNSGKTALHIVVRLLSHPSKDDSEDGLGEKSDTDEGSNNDITREESGHSDTQMQTQSSEEAESRELKEEITDEKVCEMVRLLLEKGAWVDVQDCNGETPLHEAARSHHKLVETLLSATNTNFQSNATDNRDVWISMCDFSGETALHEAARVGNLDCAKLLLNKVTKSRQEDLLRVIDMENKTALDWAALKGEKSIIEAMMHCTPRTSSITKEFLMWHLKDHVDPDVHHTYCSHYGVKPNQTSLLRTAVNEGDVDIARQLINKGADVTSLDYDAHCWLAQNLGKMASDQPTSEDFLGRKELVKAVATLLLNPYTQTPLTIGIFGSWGIGKSSFMLQVEEAMLYMAVKETFKKVPSFSSLDKESFTIKFSKLGAILRYMVVRTLKHRMEKANKYKGLAQQEKLCAKLFPTYKETISTKDIENQNPLKEEDDIIDKLPMELQSNDPQLFKTLALTDRSKLVQSHASVGYKRKVGGSSQTLQDIHLIAYRPAVLTLHYNAWQYDNKTEASAGLAVEISRQLERFMTPHQWLKMCWKYSWKSRPGDICVHLLLPVLIAIITISAIVIFWKLVSISTKLKCLSLPLGIVGVMWTFFKACLQIIQPVTQAMVNLVKTIDHQSMLGYQHQVIDDIKFLKYQLCEDAHFGWMILSFVCQLVISKSYFMEGTWIWKQHPCLNNFRIVVFIDDLDRCDEKTILELLQAINLILGSCGINVLIGVDKEMVQRAITREFLKDTGDKVLDLHVDNKIYSKEIDSEEMDNTNTKRSKDEKDSQNVETSKKIGNDGRYSYTLELSDNYLQKIIQLPIQMPDPSRKAIERFVQGQVGQLFIKKHKVEDQEIKSQEGIQKEKNETKKDLDEIEGKDVFYFQSEEIPKKDDEEELAKKEKGIPQIQDGRKDGVAKPIVFQLLLANYTPMEKDMLKRLCQLATKERRLPREWKRFFNYHRLAWTILSQDSNMKSKEFKGWQRKLILWIFICWNWRPQMDFIFLNWHGLISKSSRWQSQILLSESKETTKCINLDLSDIISAHMESMGWSTKDNINQNREKQGSGMVQKHWVDLYNTIKDEYDIPMHFIAKFQQFRFYCVLNRLEIGK